MKASPPSDIRGIRMLICLLSWLIALLGIMGCSSCSKSETGSLSGTVIMENDTADPSWDPVDFAGVTMNLYEIAQLDTTLVRINSEYPVTGVLINQELEFDPNAADPVATTLTDAAGNFAFPKMPYGNYNLVCSKQGWGTVYRFNINIDHNNSETNLEVTLYPVTILPAVIESAYTFLLDHGYQANADVSFVGGCFFQGGSRIEISPTVQISIYGNVVCDDNSNFTHFLPVGMSEKSARYDRWNTIKIHSNNQTIRNITCWGANTGISLFGNDCTASNVYVHDSDNGIYAGATRSTVEQALLKNISARAVLYNPSENSTTINHVLDSCVFYRCVDGLRTQGQAIRIKNNYFVANNNAIHSFRNYHIIENNNFDQNDNAIVCAGTRITIQYNNFYSNPISITFSGEYYAGTSQPVINNNNFFQNTGYAIKMVPLMYATLDIDAKMNYWKTNDIDAVIYDTLDYPPVYQTVVYLPKRNQPVANCGIVTL